MTAQKEFDDLYITSSEICRRLRITRASITSAKNKNQLPDPIMVENHLTMWKRGFIEPYIEAWEKKRNARIGV